ncbi:sigma-70 family RNA polymerase sigma factor [Streptomyces prunicolor]|uniref:sigma-70 family RNA polymerase sigma factor n=1 Tax=Streptomyces prunicolor TaxID=67348 RepID=UPI00224F8323|nr:sigma-70 family RNA polymerase sigma factor [Streptomyces prunicolor]MCX5239728.1 sigma-70 family RNA polymerase sigma factor [Streptomyces prunicolor]
MITEANAAPRSGDTREPALITRAQQRDPHAFAELYRANYDDIFGYILKRVSWNHQVAEDLTADVFLKAFKKIDTFRWTGAPIGAWFCAIARNVVADHYKVASTKRLHFVGDMRDVEDAWGAPAGTAEDTVLAALDGADLLAALGGLLPRQQEVLRLRFLDEMSLSETADAFGVTPGAVKQLQFRAIGSLRKAYRGAAA